MAAFLSEITSTRTLGRCVRPTSLLRTIPSAPLAFRYYSSTPLETVPLAFHHVPAEGADVKKDQSLVICHGLFGSKQNWRTLSKALAQKLRMQVFVLDLRNHGTSPHKAPNDYEHMAADVSRFLKDQGLNSGVNLLGHSMGGKVVMSVALNKEYNSPLRTLISADMAAARGKISKEFIEYAYAMQRIEEAGVKSKSAADKLLAEVEPELSIRQFLLTNSFIDPETKTLKFRIPLDILSTSIPAIGHFPYAPGEATWEGPALFVKGAKARYITERNEPITRGFFPNMRLETFDTGHWVHAEKPEQFIGLVKEFVEAQK